mgnify:CR=1 FL=1
MIEAEKKLTKARVQLLLNEPFFGNISMYFTFRPINIGTAGVDGDGVFYYNPGFVNGLDVEETKFLFAHEVLHIALGHLWRRGSRDIVLWNMACDYVINLILKKAGFKLLEGCLINEEYDGMSTEEVYEILQKEGKTGKTIDDHSFWNGDYQNQSDSKQNGKGKKKEKEGKGKIESNKTEKELIEEWKLRVAQASTMAQMRGNLPAGVERIINEILYPKKNWKQLLLEYVSTLCKNGWDWNYPNSRYVDYAYLPSRRGKKINQIVVAIDTSGSISDDNLKEFVSEVKGIIDSGFKFSLVVVFCDSEIQKVLEFDDYEVDEDTIIEIAKSIKGGGGTSHLPIFEYIEKNDITPDLLICLTDGYSEFPSYEPSYPVLFVLTKNHSENLPQWGEKIVLEEV